MGANLDPLAIHYTGVFDYYQLYGYTIQWFEKHKMQVHHILYKDKPDTAVSREKVVSLQGVVKVDEYHKWKVDIKFEISNGADILVDLPGGSKKQMIRGKMRVTVSAEVVTDYSDNFNTPFLKKLKKFMEQYVLFWAFAVDQYTPLNSAIIGLQKSYKAMLHMDTARGVYGGT